VLSVTGMSRASRAAWRYPRAVVRRALKRLLLLLLGSMSSVAGAQQPVPRPKLVVVIVIDQFRADFLPRFRPYFSPGGFNLFLRRGANFTEAAYQHAVTFTCPGHAVVLTGTHADVNGIISNQWYDPASASQEYCAADTAVTLIGASGEGRSARNLIGSTVGDQLKEATGGRSRVITLAGKDRSAIMLGGHRADAAYWIDDSLIVTSTAYMQALPGWVTRFNAPGRIRSYAGKSWGRLLPRAAYSVMGADDVAAEENIGGMGRIFPHPLAPDTSSRFFDAFATSPFQNEVLFQFARAAVINERMGDDADPDLLGISLSANDLIGHAFGPNSHEVMDVTVRTDRLLQDFFSFLNQRIGLRNVLIVLTADHGVAPLPELMQDPSVGGARLNQSSIANAVEAGLRAQYGAAPTGGWMAYMAQPWIYLNVKGLNERGISIEDAERTARAAAQSVPEVHQAFTATELSLLQKTGMASGPAFSFYPARSGNVYYELRPYVVPGDDPSGTTHGSPWSYDTRVPLLWLGASVRRGTYGGVVSIADIAPTLSSVLGIDRPSGSRGRVLQEMLR
jgi:predicted AlkP superfamily pyrophosphatase or phosphodiesterase